MRISYAPPAHALTYMRGHSQAEDIVESHVNSNTGYHGDSSLVNDQEGGNNWGITKVCEQILGQDYACQKCV